jgi:NAD(P)-dependent dehydrogenase (short-subunit alcohol dehydrogenase family)
MSELCTLITGASSGIGRSIAQELAGSHNLVLACRHGEKLEEARRTWAAPGQHHVWAQDLSQLDGIGDSLTSLLISKGIGIEHFIHSAGVFDVQPVRAVETAAMVRLFNVNLFSAVEIIRLLVRQRINKKALRSITFISSISSRMGTRGFSIYAASKGAVNALTRSLAVELAPEVRVNAILPGPIVTERTEFLFGDAALASLQKTCPLGLGRAEDVANLVEFLISDRARWITGQEIIVDGGKSISLGT